jgi:hypothetical protein
MGSFFNFGGWAMRCSIGFLGIVVALGGCANVPELDLPHKGVTVHHILNRIKCELIQARNEHPELKNNHWSALGALTVQVDDEGSVAANNTFMSPLAAAGTSFAFAVGGGITADRQRIYSENFSIDIAGLKEHPKTCDVHYGNPLLGDLGIDETIAIGLRSLKRGGPVDYNDPSPSASGAAFGESIQFVLTATLSGVGPTWTLVRFTGPTGSLAGAFRKDTNMLLISFAPGPAAPGKSHAAIVAFGTGGTPSGESVAAANNLLMLIQCTHGRGL